MSDYFDSFKLFLYERVSNPLFSSFIVSWIIFNYLFVMIFFSGENYSVKLHLIYVYFGERDFLGVVNSFGRGLIYPLISSLLYIFLFPIFSKYIVGFHYSQATVLKNLKNEAEGEILVTKKQAREFIREKNEAERALEDLRERHKAEVKSINSQAEELNSRIEGLQRSLVDKEKEISELKTTSESKDSSYKKLETVNGFMEIRIESLEKENLEINQLREKMSNQVNGLVAENKKINSENVRLRNEISSTKAELLLLQKAVKSDTENSKTRVTSVITRPPARKQRVIKKPIASQSQDEKKEK